MKLFFAIVFVLCNVVLGEDVEDSMYKDTMKFVEECGSKELTICIKERALKYMETLPNNLDMGGGVKIKQNGGDVSRISRQHAPIVLPDEPRARENALDNALLTLLADYLSSHTLEFKVPSDTMKDLQRSLEEGRKKKQKKGGMMSMMMLFQLKAAVLGALAIKLIGLVAFKALLIAKIALTIASLIALKKLVGDKHHTSTYEVVAHPHYDEHSHYDRSFSQELAYRGHERSATRTSNNYE